MKRLTAFTDAIAAQEQGRDRRHGRQERGRCWFNRGRRGAGALYLPPYSADFNPSELAWSQLKKPPRR